MATKAKKAENAKAAEWMYEIVRRPIVTEKSANGSSNNQMTFEVLSTATKPQIKAAVEAIFGVKVKGVNTLVQKGKTKFFRGTRALRGDMKKAIVRLEEGQAIDIGTGA
ncbi:MAG: 50S ribosomal protein L23 [Alphaproteobacteria bacterium]|nr:50S ribosomal protein L23 [Alphaproteobacteria bacterium]